MSDIKPNTTAIRFNSAAGDFESVRPSDSFTTKEKAEQVGIQTEPVNQRENLSFRIQRPVNGTVDANGLHIKERGLGPQEHNVGRSTPTFTDLSGMPISRQQAMANPTQSKVAIEGTTTLVESALRGGLDIDTMARMAEDEALLAELQQGEPEQHQEQQQQGEPQEPEAGLSFPEITPDARAAFSHLEVLDSSITAEQIDAITSGDLDAVKQLASRTGHQNAEEFLADVAKTMDVIGGYMNAYLDASPIGQSEEMAQAFSGWLAKAPEGQQALSEALVYGWRGDTKAAFEHVLGAFKRANGIS